MGRSLDEVIAAFPLEEHAMIGARSQGLKQEVEGLRKLRQIASKAQPKIAAALNFKQPSVCKIEKQAELYLSTLRSFIEAVGGKLGLLVKLPKRPAMHTHHLAEVATLASGQKLIRATK
jgi:Helix-turn-helix domain